MKRTFSGEFEEVVMLAVAIPDEGAYRVLITQEIEHRTGRVVGFNSVHTTLQRLEAKGCLSSSMGGATPARRKKGSILHPDDCRTNGPVGSQANQNAVMGSPVRENLAVDGQLIN